MNESIVTSVTSPPNAGYMQVLPPDYIAGKENGPSILRKLLEIMKENEYIQKSGQHPQGYKYVKESDLKRKIGASLVKHGVVFVPGNAQVWNAEFTRPGKDNKPDRRESITTVLLSFRFLDTVSGEYVQGQMPGQGVDGGDKGVYKAITGAIKYILTSTFLIETGDDPENEPEPPKEEPKKAPAPMPKADHKPQEPNKAELAKAFAPTAIPGVVTGAAIPEPKKADSLAEDDLTKDRAPGQELPTDAQAKELNKRIIAFAENAGVSKAQIGVFLKNKLSLDPTASLTLAYKKFSFTFLVAALDKYLKPEFAEEIKKAV